VADNQPYSTGTTHRNASISEVSYLQATNLFQVLSLLNSVIYQSCMLLWKTQ